MVRWEEGENKMTEINQPLTKITVYQCPSCMNIIKDDQIHTPYKCPFGCPSTLIVLRTEYEARGTHLVEKII